MGAQYKVYLPRAYGAAFFAAAHATQIDLLVMVNYKHSILEQIIKEPVIKKIGFNPHVPFLILPNINNQ